MNEEQLQRIEKAINGEYRADDVWFIETVQALIDEVRRLRRVEDSIRE